MPEQNFAPGDVNEDGAIDASDASATLSAYAAASTGKEIPLTEAQKKAADVNADGVIDASDATTILRFYTYASTGGTLSFTGFLKLIL